MSIFDFTREPISITKPIRLIELFAGYGSQAMALKRIGAKFEHYRVVEFDKYAIASYNAVHGTDFPTMDITKVHAEDLNICDTNAFTYLLTYSFPCTDLSVAGKQAGMSKGSGTRSGLLWEVERILTEIRDSNGELPQILFMENVPQVHSQDNMPDFRKWLDFLESLGYTNYYQDLNAKNYGVAQNRERCFMFSFLGEYNYHFPQPVPLKKKLKDYLEDNVDEKYYINNEKADKLIKQLIDNGTLPQHNLDRQTDRQSLIKLLQYVFGYVALPFGEIATIVRGASPRPIRSYITTDKDGVCWIKIGDVKPNTKYIVSTAEKITKGGAEKSRYVKKGDFILSNSMSFGRPYILKIDGCIHDGWLAISDYENWLLPDYLYHLLNSNEIQQEMKKKASFGGAVQNLNADIVRELELPIPSLEKQSDIVAILDRFDTLCNDLTKGLPAEIEARQKQYEYYRDKLLAFKELDNCE